MIDSNVDEVLSALSSSTARALEACGLYMESYAKSICPVDTGNLRNSITHASDETRAIVGTNVEYAPFVELGTKVQKAKPFLTPAVSDNMAQFKELLHRYLT